MKIEAIRSKTTEVFLSFDGGQSSSTRERTAEGVSTAVHGKDLSLHGHISLGRNRRHHCGATAARERCDG